MDAQTERYINSPKEHLSTPQRYRMRELVVKLRSGEYPQVQNVLHTPKGYCCLGVACDLSELGGWFRYMTRIKFIVSEDKRLGTSNNEVEHYSDDLTMPEAVVEYYGFAEQDGKIVGLYGRDRDERGLARDSDVSCASLNDTGCTFDQIADILEMHYDLFESEPAQ
jgi:hypothetical protein